MGGEALSSVTRRAVLKWIVASGGMTLVAACAPGGTPQARSSGGAPRRGGTVLVAQQNDTQGFDPHRSTGTPNSFNQIYNALVRWQVQPDGSIKPAPDLATEWDLRDDVAVFTLRRGVTFHDGSEWDAAAAKFNLERLKDAKSTAASFVASIKSIEAMDKFTVKLNLKGPAGSLLSNLSQAADGRTFMISKVTAERAGDRYGTSPDTTAGTGPMKLAEWVPGSHHVIQRTGNYWEKGADGRPLTYFDALRIRFVSDDSVRLVELRSGNVDAINALAAKDVDAVRRDPEIELVENPYQVGAYQFTFSAKRGPFSESQSLRQAVHWAIDREAAAKVLGQGSGAPMYYFLTPGYLGYDDRLPRYALDKARARQLLRDAGYANGIDVQLSVINRALDQQQAQMLKQMLGEVGIRLSLDVLERLAWTSKMKNGNYDMATFFTNTRPDPDSILAGRFESKEGKNYAGLADPILDAALARGRSSYDDKQRADAYRDVQKRMFDTGWYGTIWFSKYYDAHRKRLRGWVLTQEPYWDLRQAWLEK